MPEDNSDDSSIPDCCRTKQVAIRNKYDLHNIYQQRRFWFSDQMSGMRIGFAPNPGHVHYSRFAKITNTQAAFIADVFARRSSEKEAGLRGKILLFFTSVCKVSVRRSQKLFDGIMSAFKKAGQALPRMLSAQQLRFTLSSQQLHFTFCSQQLRTRIFLQPKI